MTPWAQVGLTALLAVAAIYLYAAAALWAHARLSRVPPPRSLAQALLVGALVPACGCTALPYARRAPAPLRGPFLAAAYAANPLLALAAGLLAGPWAAAGVVAVALTAAALAGPLAPATGTPGVRLDDLLLRRDANPWRDATPYVAAYALPALAVGGLLGGAVLAGPWVAGAAFALLAACLGAPRRDLAADHGTPFARRLFALHLAFAALSGVLIVLLGGESG